eukprot:3509477-Pyramimonas_sp.AAC.1
MVKYLSTIRKTTQKFSLCPFWSGRPTSSTRAGIPPAYRCRRALRAVQRPGITFKLPAIACSGKLYELLAPAMNRQPGHHREPRRAPCT